MPPCYAPAADGPEVDRFVHCMEAPASASGKDASVRNTTPCPPRRGAGKAPLRSYTAAQVAAHNTKGDAWLIYKKQVLDISKWMGAHPGGEQTILRFAGMDATNELRAFHDDWVLEKKVPPFVIGTVSDAPEATALVQDFRALGDVFDRLGYFHVSPGFYARKIAAAFSLFVSAVGLLLRTESLPAHLAAAVLMGLFWQQMAFVGHDLGHMSVRTHARDRLDVPKLRFLYTFFNGISGAWWNATHNVHHAVPNTVDCDPDIAHLPVFAVDTRMFGSLFNKYHNRVMEFDWPARKIFVPYQHFWYYPIMCVARFNLHIQSLLFFLTSNDGHNGRTTLDTVAFVGYFSWFPLMVSCLPTWGERAAFLLLSHAVAGLLNVQITLSHFSQPIFDSPETEGVDKYGGDFYSRNIISSLDVDCPTYLDWFHGGLQFQTLHHLYPRLGREHLRKTEPLIASLCKKHALPYARKSFLDCNREVIETLKHAAVHSRTWSPLIYESMCAEG